jgi:hypothetical protein
LQYRNGSFEIAKEPFMKNLSACIAIFLMLSLGCKLIAAAGEGGEELISSKHHPDDAPVAKPVHDDEPVPEVKSGHPRLFFADAEIPSIKVAIQNDPALAAKFDLLRREGEKDLTEPPAEYVKDTEKALIVSRLVLARVSTLAGLYRLTGDVKFAARARDEMLAAAAFPDWHPVDFLPTAELLNALGIGYDWLYHTLSPTDRDTIYQAILSKGLRPAKSAYDHNGDWTYTTSNHNIVGNGGVAVAAVAVADDDPKFARQLIGATRRSLPPAMDQYSPDGAWPEGPIYWDYATRYATFSIAALDSGLGTDFGAATYPGLAQTGMFRIYSTGPTKKTFNFGDAEEQIHPAPFMFYLAKRFKKPIYAAHENYVSLPEANMFEVIWRARYGATESFETTAQKTLPLDAIFRGVDVAFLRGDWADADTTWVGFKGGTNKGSHRHLDLGSFVMDALGQRWALDLGPDDYGLPGYNGSDKRWTYYRCSTDGHNTLTIDQGNQDPDGDSKMVAFHSGPDRSYAVVDMTNAYPNAHRMIRGIELINHKDVAVIDEVDMGKPSRITWHFHTRAKISIDKSTATLLLASKTLRAQILEPAGATFEVVSANPPRPQKQEPDVSDLIVHMPGLVTHTRIIVLLTPEPRANLEVRAEGGEHAGHLDQTDIALKFEPLDAWIQASPVKHVHPN